MVQHQLGYFQDLRENKLGPNDFDTFMCLSGTSFTSVVYHSELQALVFFMQFSFDFI